MHMKRFKVFGGVLLTALLIAVPVSGASAAAKVLELKEAGVPVATGATTVTGMRVDGCEVYSEGKMLKNGSTSDKLSASKVVSTECEGGSAVVSITEATFT